MDLLDWNECLFDALVRDVGAPGDPLYLYVDDDVLASASGMSSPGDAVQDFKQAFRATSFAVARQRAGRWKRAGYVGVPPHVAALAMTVLGVTLPPLGRAGQNVYSRQRELLGLDDLDGGAPPGYEDHVPALWRYWNEWLDGPGAIYGAATAASDDRYTFQGWARSQSFIRARDKQDIYAFLGSQKGEIGQSRLGSDPVRNLVCWLQIHRSRSPLLRVAQSPDHRDELGRALALARNYWNRAAEAKAKPARLSAVPHWSPDTRKFSLVVVVGDQRGAYGVEVLDLGLNPWTVGPHDHFMYLTPEEMDARQWARTPIRAWRFSSAWIVDWEPPANGIWAFEEVRRGDWVMTGRVRPEFVYRVLLSRERGHLPEHFTLVEAPSRIGYWVQLNGSPLIRGSDLLPLLGRESAQSRTLSLKLQGGLKVDSGATYLVGGEPDIEIGEGIDVDELVVSFDGGPVSPEDFDPCEGGVLFRVHGIYPGPGEHRIIAASQQGKGSVAFVTRDALPRSDRLVGSTEEQVAPLCPILPWSPGRSSMLLLSPDGGAWSASPSSWAAPWLAQVVRGAPFDLERAIDLNNLVGLDGSKALVASRRGRTGTWRVGVVHGSPKTVAAAASLSIRPIDLATKVLMDFLFSSPAPTATSPEAEEELIRFRSVLGQNFMGGAHAYRSPDRAESTPSFNGISTKRADILPGPLPANPLDDFLYWLTQREGGVTTQVAAETLRWLYERIKIADAPDFRSTIRNFCALGYARMDAVRGRLISEPAVLALLPSAEGMSLLGGGRGEDQIEELRSPGDDLSEEKSEALQNLIVYEVVQTRAGTPAAPTTTYVRLDADDPRLQSEALGIRFSADQAAGLLEALTPVATFVQDECPSFELGRSAQFDEFLPHGFAPGGRWSAIANLPTHDSFLRARSTKGNRYLWWNHEVGRLCECGWIAGLWAFHANITHHLLVDRIHRSNQLLVSDWVPLPPSFERAIVARSGLLPRTGRIPEAPDVTWSVYENVPGRVAVKIRKLLGQTAEMRRPDNLEYL